MPNAFEIGMCCQSGDKKGKKPNWFIYWLFGMMMVKNCVCFIFSYFLCLYLHLRGLLQEICRLVDRKIFLYDAREFVYCPIPISKALTTYHYKVVTYYFVSVNSTSSTSSTKYDPDLLKSDVHHAKARVQRLKRELANINSEMDFKQRGVDTLHT